MKLVDKENKRRPFNGIYEHKTVLITGHTGFKGSWLSQWLLALGAEISGYALPPEGTDPLFDQLGLSASLDHKIGDIRDFEELKEFMNDVKPDIIFHLAAQSLVRYSYHEPLETVQVNTQGTVNLLEAVRQLRLPTAIVAITTDKCYENKEWLFGYREVDAMGGFDPYSASKGAAEILISSYRNSFFPPHKTAQHGTRLASVRAGNVIGGGDWAKDRIVPDCIRDLSHQQSIGVRNPSATRPWQHVLEPLGGYLTLGHRLLEVDHRSLSQFCEAYNFGPLISNNRRVKELVEKVIEYWGSGEWDDQSDAEAFHEASLLNLTIDKAYHRLNWMPQWDFDKTVKETVEWYKHAVNHPENIRKFTEQQINAYQQALLEYQAQSLHSLALKRSETN